MSGKGNYESHKSSSNLGPAQNLSLSPTCHAIDTTSAQTSRKRKLADAEYGKDTGESFTIRSHPSLLSPRAQKLIPRLQLPRSCLPLAYLKPLSGRDNLPGSNLFSAHIDVLEKSSREEHGSNQPTVLIAQSAVDNGLFAIERVQEGIYAICRLGTGVTVNMLERVQITTMDTSRPLRRQFLQQPRHHGDSWWNTAEVHLRAQGGHGPSSDLACEKTRKVRLCLQMPQQKSITSAPAETPQEVPPSVVPGQIVNILDDMIEAVAQDPKEVLKMVRAQYQDSLYASKSSLAYFAKGPLSRARAAFSAHVSSANDHLHLTSLLRSCILSLATMDIKYRETLPDLVQGLPFDPLSDEDCATAIDTISKKARRSKKPTVGKNGLYPGEEANVARWWLSRDSSALASDFAMAREDMIRSALLEQRARETQMQIILCLETLALEMSATSQAEEKLPPGDPIEGEYSSQNKKTKKKPKKAQDLNMLVDLLVDRLCIWQSMSVDEMKTSNSEDRPPFQRGIEMAAKVTGSDNLRQFCVDVVLPFYGARLPELTTLLCKKLGGPQKPSPRRPQLAKSASSYAPFKPGASLQRQQIRKPRRTLERVLTDERSASQKPPPSLSRSATDSILPQVKREVSDTSLSSIPLNRVVLHNRYSQREVDLHATSQAAEAKLKKRARVEQELQDAIAALKKPNPRMAVKEFVEDAERRSATSQSRKPRHSVRNPITESPQVMATPSNSRHKDVYGGHPRLTRPSMAPLSELKNDSPSSTSEVPLSIRKVQRSSLLAPDSIEKTGSSALPPAETPTRGPSKIWGRFPTSVATMESLAALSQPSPMSAALKKPIAGDDTFSTHWPSHINETPSKIHHSHHAEPSGSTTIHTTSIEAQSATDKPLENSMKTNSSPLSQNKQESIYAALGWDDVDELF